MNVLFIVNDVRRAGRSSTTHVLITQAMQRGWTVWLSSVDQLFLDVDDELYADVVPGDAPTRPPLTSRLASFDHVWVRTNPAKDRRADVHQTALTLLCWAAEAGVDVVNNPRALLHAGSKLYLSRIPPRWRPQTLVTRDRARLKAFVRSRTERTVLKPLRGTHGRDVFIVDPAHEINLNAIIDVLARQGHVVAQAWIPAGVHGDVRLILLDGELLEVDGQPAAVARVPAAGELRSNVHLGGHPARANITSTHRELVAAVGPLFRTDGLFLVGLDVVGEQVVEINVFSTGGVPDAGDFTGVDYVSAVLDALEARAPSTALR